MSDDDRIASILGDWQERRDRGEDVPPETVIHAHPDLAEALRAKLGALAEARPPLRALPADRYTEFKPVGEGGMGIVYWAIDTDLNREVAFKVIRPRPTGEDATTPAEPARLTPPPEGTPASRAFETLKQRFLQEAWVTGGLSHPGIVPVYELGQTPEGVPYYTMRFIKGERTLADAIEETKAEDIEERLNLLEPFLKVCDTLSYAHAKGVIHRDLKPDNIALGEFGEVVLIDWGLAKIKDRPDVAQERWQDRIQEYREATDLRTVASAMGTPGYMAPEAAKGQAEKMDARSDVYSLGAILFQILTGRLPFEFTTFGELIGKLLREYPPTAAEVGEGVPESLSDLCARCLAQDRDARPAGAHEIARAVRDWRAQSAIDREIEGLMRDARASIRTATHLRGNLRIRQVDAAAATCAGILKRRPEHPGVLELQKDVRALRRRGIGEKEHAARKRVLARVAFASLIVLIVLAGVVVALLQDQQREAKRALVQEAAERTRADEVAAAARSLLADAYHQGSRSLRLEGRGAAARLAAIRALEHVATPQRWRALLDADGTWTPPARWVGPALSTHSLAFGEGVLSPDGARVFALDREKQMIRWNVSDAATEVIHAPQRGAHGLALTPDGVHSFVVSPDGARLFRWGPEHTIEVRDQRSDALIQTFDGAPDSQPCLALSPDGRRLFVGGWEEIGVWDASTGEVLDSFPGGATSIFVSDDGRRLGVTTPDRQVRILDARSGQRVSTLDTRGVPARRPLILSPDGTLAIVWEDSPWPRAELRVYDAGTGRLRAVLIADYDCWPWPGAAVLTDNGSRLRAVVETAVGAAVREWELAPAPASQVLDRNHDARCVVLSPDDTLVAASTVGSKPPGVLRVWDRLTHRIVAELPEHAHTIVFSPDRSRVYANSPTGAITSWDIASQRRLARCEAHEGGVAGLALSPDGARLYSLGRTDGCVKAWETPGLTRGETLLEGSESTDEGPGLHLALSADGARLFVVSGAGRIRACDLDGDRSWQTFEEAAGWPFDVALSRDGAWLAVREPGGVRVLDAATGIVIRRCQPSPSLPHESTGGSISLGTAALAFTSDGSRLLSGHQTSGNGVFLRVWDTTTGEVVADLPPRDSHEAHRDPRVGWRRTATLTGVNCLAVTRDDAVLYSAGEEGVSAWNLRLLLVDPSEMLRECEERYGERLDGFDARVILPVAEEDE